MLMCNHLDIYKVFYISVTVKNRLEALKTLAYSGYT